MKGILRRIRGTVGTGLTWAVGWGIAFLGFGLLLGRAQGELSSVAFRGVFFGFVGGVSFALILSFAERRRTLDQLSLWRVALWGFVGATALLLFLSPTLLGPELSVRSLVTVLAFDGLIGAGFASGSVALARQSDTKLVEGEEESGPSLEDDLEPERIG